MSTQEASWNIQNTHSPSPVKPGISFGLAPVEFSSFGGCVTNGQDRNGTVPSSSMGPPGPMTTPVRDNELSKPSGSSASSSSSSKDPSRPKDGHSSSSHGHSGSSSSGHRTSSSSSSKPSTTNGDSSHSRDHKHHSSHSSSSSRPRDSSESNRDQDKHRSSSSSSSTHKDRDHSKSKDHHSSSHSKSHSSSSGHGSSGTSSSSKPKEDSSLKHKHSSSSSSSHKTGDGKEGSDKDRHHSSKSHSEKPKERSHSDKPRERTEHASKSNSHSAAPESGSNVSVKIDGNSIKMKIGMSPSSKQSSMVPEIKTEPKTPVKVKTEMPAPANSDDEDEVPLSERIKAKSEPVFNSASQKRKRTDSDDDSDTPLSERKHKKLKAEAAKRKHEAVDSAVKTEKSSKIIKTENDSQKQRGKKVKVEEDDHSWRWWEEEPKEEGVKWKTLEHKGPVFAPLYEPVPDNVKFYYDGKMMKLSEEAEEVAGFYARMLDHDYTTRELFNTNFFKDWRKVMTKEERNVITDLKKCNFRDLYDYFKLKSEERKNMSKEEKLALKKENEMMQKEYGICIIDGHKQKIGNYKIEPPGLFRGRGEHPKQGMLKRRVQPEDIIINCSKGSKVPVPPAGHKWKEVRHDNTVTWLASWTENVQGQTKYIMLNAASKLKGEKDFNKYETARKLHRRIDQIRETYREDWKSKEMRIRQRAVALYFIDKLALRAGNEKDEDTADTVGCCSLRVEHIKLHETYDDKECVVEFDFLGKDSIRYYNRIPVEKRVFKNLQLFMENKQEGDDLFDRLNTTILNKHLQTLMDGLTAKVFRTYNASHTLQEQLNMFSKAENFAEESVASKLLTYNRANRAVAILCNHQRAVPKNFGKQMENLQTKIDAKRDQVKAAKKELKDAKTDAKHKRSESSKNAVAKKKKALERLKEQLQKLEVQATDKDENKEIALGTSKLNYLDPRISIAWCKKWNVPIEKIFNKTQREKFAWAIDMATADYQF